MSKITAYFIPFLLVIPAIVHAYPLENTEFLKAAYCFHMSNAPKLEVDLSGAQKDEGERRFFEVLHSRELEFPQGESYEDIKNKFIFWVVPRFRNEATNAALIWYKDNCLSNGQ